MCMKHEIMEIIRREFVYISHYFMIQIRQIAGYWILGMIIGSLVSVFAKDAIHGAFDRIRDKKWGVWGIVPASLLGIASPLCMYGTIPIAASFSRHGMRNGACNPYHFLYCLRICCRTGGACFLQKEIFFQF